MLCTVCHKSKVPNYFLIKCISCANSWHHRCHSPPIPDTELINIIRAFNDARTRNSGATLNWKCGACRKPKPTPIDPGTKHVPIVIDDDDDEVQIIQPPVTKKSTIGVPQPVRIIDDPIDFLVSPSADRQQRPLSSTSTIASGFRNLSVSNIDHSERNPLLQQTNSELHSQRASTPSHLCEYAQARSKTPENHSQSSRARTPTNEGSASQPSTPTMAPASAPPSPKIHEGSRVSPGLNERPFLERWSTATVHLPQPNRGTTETIDTPSRAPVKPPLFHPALLPHYINSQYQNIDTENESDKKTDVWYLAALGKSKEKDAGSAHGQSTGAKAASDPPRPRRRGRSTTMHYEAKHGMENPPNVSAFHESNLPFYFSVNTWMKANQDALASFEANANA